MKYGYSQIEVKDLVDAVGGTGVIQKADDPYTLLTQAHEELVAGLLTMYTEVGEVDLTELQDFCDNLRRTKDD